MNAPAQMLPVVRGTVDGANCAECPLSKNGVPYRPVFAEGCEDPAWIVVGEGPGMQEQRVGRPFVGPSGNMVDRTLATIKVDRTSLWVTNATLCLPPPNGTDAMKKKAQQCCAPRLAQELSVFPGKPVLALGSVAAQGFLGDKFSITAMAGALFSKDIDGTGERYVIPTIHPAAILRGGSGGGGGGAHTADLLFVNLIYDANKVARLAAGKQVVFTPDIDVEVVDPEKAEAIVDGFFAHVRSRKGDERMMACDIEAVAVTPDHSALEPMFTKITVFGFATTDWGISVAWHILTRRAKRLLTALLGDPSIAKAGHNYILYDKPALNKDGMPTIGQIDDTMLMHHNAFPGSPHDLQRVATQFFAIPPWKSEHRTDKKFALHVNDLDGSNDELVDDEEEVAPPIEDTEPEDGKKKKKKPKKEEDPAVKLQKLHDELYEHGVYNATDTLATARLVGPLRHAILQNKADKTYAMDLDMAHIAAKMHLAGIPVDRERNKALDEQFTEVIDRAKKVIEDRVKEPVMWAKFVDYLCGEQAKRPRKDDPNDYMLRHAQRMQEAVDKPPEFKISAGEHVAAYLKARGVPMLTQTEKGRTSTKRDILEGLTHVPEVREILDHGEARKMRSTYVRNWAKALDQNGRMHPRWSVNKITGRWGAEAPAVMNVPKEMVEKNRPNMRRQVVAPKKRKLVGADYAALEGRVIALISGDPFLCGIFAHPPDKYGPGDVHSQFARVVWPGYDTDAHKSKLRDMIKRVIYGTLYGGEAATLHASVIKDYPEVTLGQIRHVMNVINSKTPGVAAFYANLTRTVMQTGEIRSFLLGRRRTFPTGNADPTDLRNFGVQSSGADIMNTGLKRLVAEYKKIDPTAEVILQIHDALVVECAEECAEEMKACVERCLTQTHSNGEHTVLFPVEAEVGDDWSQV